MDLTANRLRTLDRRLLELPGEIAFGHWKIGTEWNIQATIVQQCTLLSAQVHSVQLGKPKLLQKLLHLQLASYNSLNVVTFQ